MIRRVGLPVLVVLLLSVFAFSASVQTVEASGTVYIRSDGSIVPPTALISTADNVTYVFTGNISDSIVVERDNIVIDGNGKIVFGSGIGQGITLSGRSNVTVENTTISNFRYGVLLDSSSDNVLSGNNVTANHFDGVYLDSSSNNVLSGNNVTANHFDGVHLDSSSNNVLSGNNVANNEYGIRLYSSSGNSIFHNSLVNNIFQGRTEEASHNTWDDGYPSGGNYWGGYAGADSNHDGMADSNYTVAEGNVDRYPLMGAFSSFDATKEHAVETICNSTVSDFVFNSTAISFNVSGEDGTVGFCRICMPTALIGDSYRILANGTEINYTRLTFCDNSTHRYVYFNYTLSTKEIVIIPEFPTLIILALSMIMALFAVAIHRRSPHHNKRCQRRYPVQSQFNREPAHCSPALHRRTRANQL